jgi:anaerobic selenocysteine-containing dehydrogenase
MDCPDTCALEVQVVDGRIEKIGGRRDHPTTNGFICTKVSRFGERVDHPDRLLYPMQRRGPKGAGEFVRISWDEAIAEITRRFREIRDHWGGEAILPYHYGGSNGFLSEEFLDDVYFARLGASRLAKTLCAGPTTEVAVGMYGKMPGVAFEDYCHARFILVWGANPKVSHIHLVPFLRQAKRDGAFIAVVDPLKNFSSREVDLHLPVFPGADLPVALAMIRLWKEEGCLDTEFLAQHADGLEPLLQQADAWPLERAAAEARVPAEEIRTLARRYAESSPALLRCGWGVERNRNGGQAVAAILAMPALLGKFGIRGGGYTMSNSGAAKIDRAKLFGELTWNSRVLNMSQLSAVLGHDLQPPIKGLFVYNCNPAVTVPDQNAVLRGLARDDLFTVVFEQVMTDTARYADILLPATTFLEHWDIRVAYGSYVVGGVQPAIPPRGEARSNVDVFAALGRAMGFEDEAFSWDAETCVRKVAEALCLHGKPANPDVLAAGEVQRYDFPGSAPVQFQTVFPQTADGKIHLTPAALGQEPFRYHPVHSERFPLALVTPASPKMISSTLGEFNLPQLTLTMNPADASRRWIEDGDTVRVFNELGEVICQARVSDRVREGVVSMPKGAWRKATRNGATSTALCPAHVNQVGGGACYNDARLEVERME